MKRIAVFGYGVMSLEAMSRLNQEQCSIIFIGKDDAEAALVAEKGFDTKVIDFRNDDALRSIGIGTDVDTLFCFYPRDFDNVFLTISARAIDKNITIVALLTTLNPLKNYWPQALIRSSIPMRFAAGKPTKC